LVSIEKFVLLLKSVSEANHSKFTSLDQIREYKYQCQAYLTVALLSNQVSLQLVFQELNDQFQKSQAAAELERQKALQQQAQAQATVQQQAPIVALLKSMVCHDFLFW